ncbi:hypothetical protein [Nocardioides soli]|uniref:Uncharacterized protein n=1 Tax=Nocardioides soli TaxID=1036020 RepID=A0A7W4Z294_9ACTN|nr:hypothetical protein [Nocardioides soli]MBB3043758.1 hypothetical protein [Nocardioides soli]
MRAYRGIWATAIAGSALAALLAGGARLGWWGVAGTLIGLAVLGGSLALSWVEGERRWRIAGSCASWLALTGLLLVGLPCALGGWGVLVLLGLAVSSPPLLERGARWLRGRSSAATSDTLERWSIRDLERRWLRTSEQLRDRRTPPGVALQLVCERERLLDAIERSNPGEFAARLARSGWPSAGSVVDL